MEESHLLISKIDALIEIEKSKRKRELKEEEEQEEGEIIPKKKMYQIQTKKTTQINLYEIDLSKKFINHANHRSKLLFQSVINCGLHFDMFKWIDNKPILTVSAIEYCKGDFDKQIQALIGQLEIIPIKYDIYNNRDKIDT
jgi:hypothetical protein